jgi:hypothetical protein
MANKSNRSTYSLTELASYYLPSVQIDPEDEYGASRLLMIPDCDNEADFVKAAKRVWRVRHGAVQGRGRPSERGRVFAILYELYRRQGKVPSQGEQIREVQKQFANLGTYTVSPDAILKHVKQWRIFASRKRYGNLWCVGVRFDGLSTSPYRRWLKKHAAKTVKAIENYLKVYQPWRPGPTLEMLKQCTIDGKVNLRRLFELVPYDPKRLKARSELSLEIQDMLPSAPE